MKKDSVLGSKSYDFALRVVKCVQYLQKDCSEYVLSKQLIRSGGIGEAFIENGLKWMRDKGCKKIDVVVVAGNEDVFCFYEKFGFRHDASRLRIEN